jgi:hypothetical protein
MYLAKEFLFEKLRPVNTARARGCPVPEKDLGSTLRVVGP